MSVYVLQRSKQSLVELRAFCCAELIRWFWFSKNEHKFLVENGKKREKECIWREKCVSSSVLKESRHDTNRYGMTSKN